MNPSSEEEPYFSLIIAVTPENEYLLSLTLESIAGQTFRSYQIVLVDSRAKKGELELLGSFPKIKCIEATDQNSFFALLNIGVHHSLGNYCHFLAPGEFYLSPKALFFMKEFLDVHVDADIAYTGFILRHSLLPSQTFFLEFNSKDGSFPTALSSFWFKKESFGKIGPFSDRYESGGGVDLICRFFLETSLKKVFMKRIVVDYQYQLKPSKKILRQFFETMRIIYSYFGAAKPVFWWLAENPLRFAKWGIENAKIAVGKKNGLN